MAGGTGENFEVVGLAASAGGLTALTRVLSALERDFPAAVLVVQHLDPRHRSLMAEILGRRVEMPVKEATEGELIEPGRVFIAPPNHHLLVGGDGRLDLTETELVHFVRPSADLLFESMAASFRDRAIAVILSGTGSDGAMGARAVRQMGGTVIAQDAGAEFSGMPMAAIEAGAVDFVLPLDEVASALVSLVHGGRE
jgi:two-component system chemotaxis response regulator CheB